QFKQRGSILFVSHDSGAVSRLCDRVLWLDRGQVQAVGEPREILDRYHEHLYAEQQAVRSVSDVTTVAAVEEPSASASNPAKATLPNFEPWYDAREHMQGSPALYNAIAIHRFDERASGFGDGGARIVDVCFRDREGRKLAGVL